MAAVRRRVTADEAEGLVAQWRASKRALPTWCASRGIDGRSLRYWADRLDRGPLRLVDVTPLSPSGSGPGLGADLLAWRQRHIAPLVKGFKAWLKLVHARATETPKSPLAEATSYYANYWRPLTAFLRDPDAPLDNNFAERNLRAQALGRANWLFAGSHESAENTAVAYTLVQTAKLNGLDVLAYLTWALERVAACTSPEDYAALTPMAYEEAQQRARD